MDILSRVPFEIAYQILSKLDIQDVATCQRVSREWYWIATDQSIWRNVFLEHEREFAIPTKPVSTSSFSIPTLDTINYTESSVSSLTTTVEVSESKYQGQNHKSMPAMKDWKQECRNRIISDRNWNNGHIQSLFTLKVHRGGIVRLRIKGGKLLSGDMFGQVAVWNTTTYDCEDLIDAAVGPIQLLDFSPARMIMTVVSKSGICRIWDLKTKALIHSSSAIDVTCMTMNDEYLVLGNRFSEVQIVDFTTGHILKTIEPLAGETLQDIYIQNDTLIVVTGHLIRILSINTLEVLLSSPLPISKNIRTFCSVFHIRSLIILADKHLLHLEWEPLYRSPNSKFQIDTQCELPPDLSKTPKIHKTRIPPISTITSIAIGGKHPHVLTTNADRTSLNGTIRVCPTSWRSRAIQQQQEQQRQIDLEASNHVDVTSVDPPEIIGEGSEVMTTEDSGIVLTSQIDEITQYLETCGLKPSFMDVDEDVIVIGTSKGDIVVLSMAPAE
ncbi:hypothetical protein BX616_008004 [Lobosporangium transversale]|uniref:WD40-repeat-containing domain protein n=1 Tax=Lobosporangium transversale TaxID=64571 RepID=A0A1Y2H254_9FUNG|nr:WD40-repeat-containing domain protein [Lobosporangium transversale]KAF9914575.1 hypothetical protein BX616_008004 [Lobosporangium transversale]ORZ28628.1 WD40-repeat-containing domain protein [Lobosporangium transversale]|eukprot:XP_021886301.1 WD40-repeat-containing domain protein [Lobosporangium transversale]